MSRPTTAQTRKKRPLDRQLPKGIEDYLPESKLVDFENKLDATITRKKLDIQEVLSKPMKSKRILRVFVSNTSTDQYTHEKLNPFQQTPAMHTGIPAWTLKIEGRLLDPPGTRKTTGPQPKFTSFLKSVYVELQRDEELFPDGNVIEWHKSQTQPESDGLSISRHGDESISLKILLTLDSSPDSYKLSPDLARILDIHTETKANVIMGLWTVIKSRGLQDQTDRRLVNCDEELKAAFGVEKFMFPNIPDMLMQHLLPVDPIVIPYTIDVEKEFSMGQFAYDVEVEVQDSARQKLQSLVAGHATLNREISACDEKISTLIQSVHQTKVKRDFFQSFTADPVTFLKRFVTSQSEDMAVVLGDVRGVKDVNGGSMSVEGSEGFKGKWVEQAVLHYLNSR